MSCADRQPDARAACCRRSDYSTVGSVDSWKAGLDLQVFSDLRLRSTLSRDVREPTFSERFDFQGGGGSVNDPRFGGLSTQITTVSGGNPNLKPEVADTLVAGFVYQPSWLEGLRMSADWYEVEIKDAVGTLGVQRIVDECELHGNTALCQQFERDPAIVPMYGTRGGSQGVASNYDEFGRRYMLSMSVNF